MTFRALAADAPDMMTRVARFLALLELFREGVVAFDQMTPLGELSIRWTGTEDAEIEINDEFDGAPPEEPARADEARPTTEEPSDRPRSWRTSRQRAEGETLEVPLAELRPALEAVLMVADQPLDDATLATAVGYPVAEVREALAALAAEYDESGRGFELRNVAGGWRYYTREDVRAGRGAVRARGPAGPADPGGAGDARRGRLQAAGQPQPGLGDPRRQRRRRDAHAAHPRAGRGGRHRPRDRRAPLPHLELLPGADRGHLARRAARAGAVPARRWTTSTTSRRSRLRRRPRGAADPSRDPTSDTMDE